MMLIFEALFYAIFPIALGICVIYLGVVVFPYIFCEVFKFFK